MSRDAAIEALDAAPDHEAALPYLRAWAESDEAMKHASVINRISLPIVPAFDPSAEVAPAPAVDTDPLFAAIRACPHWVGAGCSCGLDLCTFPWRRRLATFDDCRSCQGATARAQ